MARFNSRSLICVPLKFTASTTSGLWNILKWTQDAISLQLTKSAVAY
jgi:hypothetical protein